MSIPSIHTENSDLPPLEIIGDPERIIMWLQPWRWVDHEDWLEINDIPDEFKNARLREILQDMIVNRSAELRVFIRNYRRAENFVGGKARELTRRQEQAVRARSEALLRGRTDVHLYVAHELGISRATATQLLARADERLEAKILHNDLSTPYIVGVDDFTPADEQVIKKWMKSHPRQCAGSGRPSTRKGSVIIPACEGKVHGNYELCYGCYQVYGNRGAGWEQWLEKQVNAISREHYQNAVEAILRAGQLEIAAVFDDYDDIADAA